MKRYSAINSYLADLENDCSVSSRRYVRSIDLMAVEACSKAILALNVEHGKSPWFLRCNVLKLVGVDYPLLVLAFANVGNFLECAF